uniref:Uncharacterized protein n=1 Tax=Gouania willdenowi TaxID=441366 RepID=A0A8C5HDC7_GOUWI
MAPLAIIQSSAAGFYFDAAAVAEQQQAVGLRGAEVKRHGPRLLGVPPGQRQVGRRRLEGDGFQGLHVLAAEDQVAMDTDL